MGKNLIKSEFLVGICSCRTAFEVPNATGFEFGSFLTFIWCRHVVSSEMTDKSQFLKRRGNSSSNFWVIFALLGPWKRRMSAGSGKRLGGLPAMTLILLSGVWPQGQTWGSAGHAAYFVMIRQLS